jgi:hypothetical protein
MSFLDKKLVFSKEVSRDTFVSTNKIYAGAHFSKRAKLKEEFMWLFHTVKIDKDAFASFSGPLHLEFWYTFSKRPFDSDNCSYMSKMLLDCLVSGGHIESDTIKHVSFAGNGIKKGDTDRIDIFAYSLSPSNKGKKRKTKHKFDIPLIQDTYNKMSEMKEGPSLRSVARELNYPEEQMVNHLSRKYKRKIYFEEV